MDGREYRISHVNLKNESCFKSLVWCYMCMYMYVCTCLMIEHVHIFKICNAVVGSKINY